MTDLWLCALGTRRLTVRCLTPLTWHEVRSYAAQKLGADPSDVSAQPAADDEPDVEVRHAGSDYSGGGTQSGRRLQDRAVGADEWRNVSEGVTA